MLRCKESYVDLCPVTSLKLVGNSLAAWPACLKNCRRIPHPLRETKPFLRDKVLCRESGGHVGNVQNNLAIGEYKGKLVALFRASETVLDCGEGVLIDFPNWQALREMLGVKTAEVALTSDVLRRLSGEAEEELAAGLAEETVVKAELPDTPAKPAAQHSLKREVASLQKSSTAAPRPQKKVKAESPPPQVESQLQSKVPKDLKHSLREWLDGPELEEYPNSIKLVSSEGSEAFADLLEEAATASFIAYDAQWSPDFDEGTDNPVALLQLAFPASCNTYVLQLPLLGDGSFPEQVKELFESLSVLTVGFAANGIDIHKMEISGVQVDTAALVDVQPWCEAEMGENESVRQGWRVGLKRAASCVLDFDMDKTCTVASSNWEREELTTAQVEYAAMDVWVALRLFQRLAAVYGSG